jgi:hypothetical protein
VACGAVISRLVSSTREPAAFGQLRVDEMYIRKRSLRFDLETHPQRAATTAAAEERVVRGINHFDLSKHRTVATPCQTRNSLTSQLKQCRVEATRRASKKPKARSLEAQLGFFLFLSSTDPVAKEHLFLE